MASCNTPRERKPIGCSYLMCWMACRMVKEQNKVGTLVFMGLYVLANFVIFVYVF